MLVHDPPFEKSCICSCIALPCHYVKVRTIKGVVFNQVNNCDISFYAIWSDRKS